MHPSVLIKRKAIAVNRIVERAGALVKRLELDPVLVAALEPKVKDTETADMLRMEALGTLIAELALSAGAPPEKQPDTTVKEFIVEASPASDELPAPALDQLPAAEPTTEEIPAEAETTEEPAREVAEEPTPDVSEDAPAEAAEEAPASKPTRKTKKNTNRKGS